LHQWLLLFNRNLMWEQRSSWLMQVWGTKHCHLFCQTEVWQHFNIWWITIKILQTSYERKKEMVIDVSGRNLTLSLISVKAFHHLLYLFTYFRYLMRERRSWWLMQMSAMNIVIYSSQSMNSCIISSFCLNCLCFYWYWMWKLMWTKRRAR
jgi:hypothetical protein